MKKQTIVWLAILLTVCNLTHLHAQVNGDFRTSNTGNFSDLTIWETYNSGWAAAVAAPTGSGSITILAAHTVTMDVSVTMASGKAFNINGTIVFPGTQQIIGTSGNVVNINAGSFFKTANANGFWGASSSIHNSMFNVPISATSTIEYNRVGGQTANQYGVMGNVTINVTGGSTVTASAMQMNGVLHMQNGILNVTGTLDICRPITGTATNLITAATVNINIGATTTAGTFIPSSITSCGVLTLNNATNPVNLNGNLTMSQAYLSGGRCNNNGFYVHITSGTGNDFANSYFMGTVRRTLPVGSNTYYFPIGNSTQQSVNITTTVATANTIVEATPFETTPTGTPDGSTCNGTMLNRHAVLKVIGANNITAISQVSFQAVSATPALSGSCRLAFSLDNSALSFQGRGGLVSGTTVTSTRALTAAQRSDLTSGDGLFMGISSLSGTPLAAGKYCIGPAASYTPPSGAAYINAATPYVSMKAALLDLNDLGVAGNSYFEFQNDYVGSVETLPIAIYYQGTVTTQAEFRIREDFSGTHAIGGFVDGVGYINAIVNFNNCSYVTINGTKNNTPGTQGLRIYNTCTSFCTGIGITINNDALNNTIKGCTIEAQSTCITTGTLSGITGSDFITVQYCKMKQYSPVNGTTFGFHVYESGLSTCKVNDVKVLDCEFENLARPIVAQTAIEGNWEFSRNHIYTTFAIPGLYYPINILMNNPGNVLVENNYIGGNAPYAQGARTPMYVSAAIINVRVRGTSLSRINGNTIRNIKPNASGTVHMIDVLANTPCQINNNLLGDSTIANSVDFTASEPVDLKFIRYTNDGTSTINSQVNNNMMANVRFQHTTHNGIHQFISLIDNAGGSGTYTVSNNTIRNISDAGTTGYQCFYLENTGSTRILTANGNVIESLSRPQNAGAGHNFYGFYNIYFTGSFNGNRIGKWNTPNDVVVGTPNINSCYYTPYQGQLVDYTNDTIANVNFTNGSNVNNTTGIHAGGGSPGNKLVNGNVIKNLSSASTRLMIESTTIASTYPLAGIILYGAGSNNQVNNNKIDGLNATSTAATFVGVVGIDISGGSAVVNNNTLYNLTNTATGTVTQPFIAGIRLMPNSAYPLSNNMIGISNGANTNAVRLYGILVIGSGTCNTYFNTVTIGGNSAGIARSAAYWKTTLGNFDLRNNIFHNNRTGGTLNYAIVNENGTGTGGGWTYASNYNNIYSANAATTGAWPLATPKTFAQWQAVSGDANSKNTDVRFVNATTDLHMATTTNCNLDKEGTNIAGITVDIDNDTRHATTPTIGADEFTYNPNWATASSNSIVCSPSQSLNLAVTDNSYGAHSYQWSGPNGYTSTAAAPVVANPTDALHTGNYTATVTDVLSCVSTPTTTSVIIYEPPVPSCPGNVSQNNDAAACGAVVTYPPATATGVPTPVIYYSHPSGSFFPVGTTTVTVSAVNYCDSVTCTFTVTVTDTELPVISNCPANINLNNTTGLCSATATWTAPTATDNCAIQTFTSTHNSGASFLVGTTTVTYTATDIHGNVQTCSFNVVVTDTELPVISNCPSNISVNNDAGLCSAIVTWTAPTAGDNCAIQTFTSTHNSGASFPVGTTTVVYTATDIHGNVQTCSFTITVTDNELPVISNCPANISVNNDAGLCTAIVTWTAPTATDNCAIQTFTSTHNSGATFPVGTTTVVYTATDIHGNVQTCSFNVVVADTELPVISNCPATINLNNTSGLCSAIATWTAPTASDNCAIQSFTVDYVNGGAFSVGTTTVTYTAIDIHGNSQTCSFNVVVTDTELPVISNCPATINLNNTMGLCSATATWTAPTATDNCAIQTFTSTHNSGASFPVGTTTVVYTATDIHGNVQTCSFNVVVTDAENPVISCPATANITADAGLCTSSASIGTATATDNCSVSSVVASPAGPYAVGTHTITWTATDASGNTATCTQTVNVTDTENPVITCPATANLTADVGLCTSSGSIGTATATDNCAGATVAASPAGPYPVGTTTVTWTATDASGNTATCTQTVNVTDTENPVITCPATANITADAGLCTSSASIGTATATDNCAGATVAASPAGPYPVGTTTVTWTATDASGNTATCTQTVNVTDTENPVITCPATANLTADAGLCTSSGSIGTATATDNCAGATVSASPAGPYPVGTTTVTWTATDASGNTATCTQTVNVTDTENPVITCPATANITTDAGLCTSSASIGTATATDNCAGATVAVSPAGPYAVGTTTVTWTATDASGNTATCTQTVNVTDTENPVITCPATANLTADAGLCTSSGSIGTATATDNCAGATVSASPAGPYPVGTTTVTWTATDASGNTATCTQTVNVTDTENPVITCPATANITVDAGLCTSSASIGTATATDNCAGATVSASPAGPYPVGTTTVTWTATDASGNTATCTQTVNVTDTENPVITCPATANITTDAGLCTSSASIGTATATDNCAGATVAASPAGPYPVGTTTVTWTATDASGNTATCTQTVNVTDTENPVITCPATANLTADAGLCTSSGSIGTATATDNCAGATVSASPAGPYPVGTTTVTWTATDASGNTATCTQTVIVTDTENPVITCPANISVCDPGSPVVNFNVTATDNCSIASIVSTPASGSTFAPGTTTVNSIATDVNGNTATCSFTVTVSTPSTAPTSATSDAPYNNICTGNSTNLTVNGGSLGTGATWNWYSGSCGGTAVGTGASINVSPTVTTTYFVRAEGACNNTLCASVTITVSSAPVTSLALMPFTGMPAHVCNGTTATISVAAVANATFYVWDAPSGSYFNGNVLNVSPFTTTTPSVTVTFGNPSGSLYNVGVQAGNACGSSIRQSQKVRGLTSVPTSISGSLTACLSSVGTYTTPAVTGATSYLWTITGDATVSGTGTTATVTFGPSWTSGTLCVASQTTCYTSPTKCISISNKAAALGAISGTFTACPNSVLPYSVPASAGAASYTWTAPPGASVTAGQGTNSVSVTYSPGYSAVGSICVSVTSVCVITSPVKCKTVAPGLPSQPSSISGPTNGLCGQSVVYTCPSQGVGVTYNWTVPAGASVVSGQGTTSVNVLYGTFTTGNVCVTASNSCGSSIARCINVKGAPATPGAITATPSSWCANTSGIEFNVNTFGLSGAYTLSWTYPTSPIATYTLGGGNSTQLVMDWLMGTGNINVTASNACGSGTRTSTWSQTCRQGEVGTVSTLTVSPNPTTGVVNINYTASKGNTVINVLDLAGRAVMTETTASVDGANNTQLDMSKLAKGAYMLSVQSTQGNKQVRIVVE